MVEEGSVDTLTPFQGNVKKAHDIQESRNLANLKTMFIFSALLKGSMAENTKEKGEYK